MDTLPISPLKRKKLSTLSINILIFLFSPGKLFFVACFCTIFRCIATFFFIIRRIKAQHCSRSIEIELITTIRKKKKNDESSFVVRPLQKSIKLCPVKPLFVSLSFLVN